jgi:hypothetical protein
MKWPSLPNNQYYNNRMANPTLLVIVKNRQVLPKYEQEEKQNQQPYFYTARSVPYGC